MGVLIASFLIQALGLVTPLFFQVVMDKVLLHQALTTLDVLAIGFLAAATFEVAFTMARNYLFNHTTTRVDVELASKLFSRLFSLPLSWFQARQTGQTVARLRELDTLRHFITSSALTVSLDLVFTLIYLIVMYFYSPTLLLVVILSFPIYIIITIIITPILRRRLNNKFEYGAAIQSLSVECINGAETVKGQAIEHQMQRKWEDLQANYALASFRAVQLAQNTSQIFGFVQKATTLLIIWLGASEVMEGDMTVGQLIAFNMLAGRISGPIIKIAQFWQDFQQAGISLNRLGDILNSPIESGFEVGRSSLPALTGRILFEHANFKYRFDSPLVLDDINIEILPGEIIGLAGRSGSGKSTLTKIVQNMYPLSGGRVMVDGVDLSMINNSWLRANIGVVSQESYLFSGSIRDNIALRDQAIPMERIMRAAIIAGAHNFIMSFPEGYETKVGENGSNLSGGQKQRLALARILIGDPKILILDEATSALDYESERIIQDNMSVICKGRTVIIIAHRLSALRSATRIIVLDKGRLVENGTPKQLMEKRGFYYNMATSQNQSN
jgi:subfamily B ATP-binding cassette protein HlyB/CyaB